MHRASPPRKVDALSVTGAAAGSPTGPSEYINLGLQTIAHKDGYAQGVYAVLPDIAVYDAIRFLFRVTPDDTTAPTGGTVTVMGRLSDGSGSEYVLGSVEMSADGQFPPFETENYQGVFNIVVAFDGGSGATGDVDTFVQGVYKDAHNS